MLRRDGGLGRAGDTGRPVGARSPGASRRPGGLGQPDPRAARGSFLGGPRDPRRWQDGVRVQVAAGAAAAGGGRHGADPWAGGARPRRREHALRQGPNRGALDAGRQPGTRRDGQGPPGGARHLRPAAGGPHPHRTTVGVVRDHVRAQPRPLAAHDATDGRPAADVLVVDDLEMVTARPKGGPAGPAAVGQSPPARRPSSRWRRSRS